MARSTIRKVLGYFTSFSFTNSCWKSWKVRKLKETLPNLVERISKKEVWESKSSNHLSSNISPTIRKSIFYQNPVFIISYHLRCLFTIKITCLFRNFLLNIISQFFDRKFFVFIQVSFALQTFHQKVRE